MGPHRRNSHDDNSSNSSQEQVRFNLRKYSNHLNTGLVWYLNGRFVSGCQIVRLSNGGLKKACLWSINAIYKST